MKGKQRMSGTVLPLVSVIIPTYNCGEYICTAVESALAQTYHPVEIVVMDDGSTDDTRKRLSAYGGRIKYIYQANQGVSAARNIAIAAAEGDVIALLDADDLCAPRRVERQMSLLTAHPNVGFVACRAPNMDLEGRLTGKDYSRHAVFAEHEDVVIERKTALLRYLETGFFLPTTCLIRKSVFHAAGGYDESLPVTQDLDLMLRVLLICDMGYVNEPLYLYRRGRAAALSATRRKTCAESIQVLEKFEQSPGGSVRKARRILNEGLARRHSLRAAYLVEDHDMQGARAHFAEAARRHPSPKTWARLALAKAGPLGYPILSWMAHRKFRNEPGG
jgi:glycosyltransferase involved in cell wall biosynthesis